MQWADYVTTKTSGRRTSPTTLTAQRGPCGQLYLAVSGVLEPVVELVSVTLCPPQDMCLCGEVFLILERTGDVSFLRHWVVRPRAAAWARPGAAGRCPFS